MKTPEPVRERWECGTAIAAEEVPPDPEEAKDPDPEDPGAE